MKRPLLACWGLLAALLPGPAAAASSYVAVEDEGPGITALNVSCVDQRVNNPFKHVAHVSGPATPPLGTGSLRLDLSAGERSGVGFEGGTRKLSELVGPGSFAVSAYSAGGDARLAAYVKASTAVGGPWYGVALLPALPVGVWTVMDLSSATYHWVDNNNANPTDLTLTAFIQAKGDSAFQAGVMADDCLGETPVYVDKLVGHLVNGAPSDIDFEAIYPTSLTASGGGLIVAGGTATLSGSLLSPGPLVKGDLGVTLQADSWPLDGAFADVAGRGTDENGQVSSVQKPPVITAYRWVFAGAPLYATSTSEAVVVEVSPLVTMKIKDTTLRVGDKVVATGTTSPAKGRVPVMLMRRVKGGEGIVLQTRKTRADGSYRLAKRLKKRGSYRIYVVVAASEGNVQGKAFRKRVRVS